jgi:membrane-associated phospholipid phosphatase
LLPIKTRRDLSISQFGKSFNYPQFPFANPPYAARAYAYVAAAQYDALVACWYYKTLYSRPAPYKTDSTINVHTKYIARSDLPSYPSEDAVLAGVTAELMKLFFPTEIAFVEQKAAMKNQVVLLQEKITRSDWTAGEALGRQIATVFAARGRTDRAGAAAGTPAIWAQMEQDCVAKGEVPWISQESPKRPPQLPLFGKVKAFLFDSAKLVNEIRPGPPPSTSSQQFKDETAEVRYYTEHPTRERMKVIDFWADGVATPTPPGHWNDIAAADFLTQNFSEVRWARNMALLNMTMMDAAIACWDAKYIYFNPRPTQVDPEIKTLTGLPNFPSYISGHSTFSAAASTILGHLIPSRAAAYTSMAQEAEMSRLYGGIHYRSDIEVGFTVGQKVGSYAVQRATSDGAE